MRLCSFDRSFRSDVSCIGPRRGGRIAYEGDISGKGVIRDDEVFRGGYGLESAKGR